MKKIIFLLVLPLVLSFQQDKTQHVVIVAYREPEMMFGNVRQVIELRPDRVPKGDKPQLVPDDTTLFDKKGDPIRTSLGEKGYWVPGFITYDTKYNDDQKGKQTTVYGNIKMVFYFDEKGRLLKEEEPGPTQPLTHRLYYYDSAGDLSGCEEYDYHNNLRFKERFEYDLDGRIISVDERLMYKYLSTDAKGNWTKRVVTWDKNHIDTVERKITYY